jgi:tetratricopeptide (TPR) repeat protein
LVEATSAPPRDAGTIAFVENDYDRALALARVRHVPLFVDAWAPWCHTCLSLRSYVFPDPALRPYADRFVWLSLDTERDENAAFVDRLAVRVLPTLFVIEPLSEQPVVAWPGSLTARELATLLDDAEVAANRSNARSDAATAMLRGRQEAAAGRQTEAIAAYRAALAAAPAGWPRRALTVDGLVTALEADHQLASCVAIGADEASRLEPGSALADVLRTAMSCAIDLPAGDRARGRLAELVTLGERVASDATQPILADDRSDLYEYVVEGMRELHREVDVPRVAGAWAAMLEEQAAKASNPSARAVFDAHRLLAYIAVGQPERAIPMLELSERDFPDDYNPPARLATAYLRTKHYDRALAAVKRAMARVYGPRKLRLWSLEADIHEARGDLPAAVRALREASDYARSVALPGSYPKVRDTLERRLATLTSREALR